MDRRPLLNGLLAAFVILVTTGCIARLLWIGGQINGEGPMALATRPQGGFVLTTDHHLYTFDGAGRQVGGVAAATLGLEELGAVQVTPDGTTWLLDKARRQLYRCSGERCAAFSAPGLDLDKNALFAVSPAHGLVAISDNNRHRLLLLDLQGRLLLDSNDRPALHFPNQVTFEDDSLLIADSDRYVVLRIPFSPGVTPVLQPATTALATQRRPYRFVRDGNGWRVLEAGESLVQGKLYHYDAGGRVATDSRARDIVDVLRLADRLVIASRSDRLLLALDPATGAETELGSPALRAAWQAQSRREAALRREREWLPLAMIALLLPALLGASLLQQQRQQEAQRPRDAAVDHGIVERYARGTPVMLRPDEEGLKALAAERNLLAGLFLAGIVAVPGICWLSAGMPNLQSWTHDELLPLLVSIGVTLPALLAGFVLTLRGFRRKTSRELVFEQEAVVLREDGRERMRAPLPAVTLTQTDLRLGGIALPLYLDPQLRRRPFWPRELIRQLLELRRPTGIPGAPTAHAADDAGHGAPPLQDNPRARNSALRIAAAVVVVIALFLLSRWLKKG